MTRRSITDEILKMMSPYTCCLLANPPDSNKYGNYKPPEDWSIWDLMEDEWLSEEMTEEADRICHPEWYTCGPEDL